METDKLALWKERIKEREGSGLTVEEWCADQQVTKYTYYYWKCRINKAKKTAEEAMPVFAELSPPAIEEENLTEEDSSYLCITWKDFELSICNQKDAIVAAEFFSHLWKLC